MPVFDLIILAICVGMRYGSKGNAPDEEKPEDSTPLQPKTIELQTQ